MKLAAKPSYSDQGTFLLTALETLFKVSLGHSSYTREVGMYVCMMDREGS